jgi:hypothetical protein
MRREGEGGREEGEGEGFEWRVPAPGRIYRRAEWCFFWRGARDAEDAKRVTVFAL